MSAEAASITAKRRANLKRMLAPRHVMFAGGDRAAYAMEGIRRNGFKGEALAELLAVMGVTAEETCYTGDDLVDLPALRQVGFPATVADAVPEVRAAAVWVAPSRGGHGAVREIIEFILKF